MSRHPDLAILGSGTTAFAAARRAAAAGRKVLMIEQSHLGGTCVNWGCIPSKTLIDKAEMYHAARRGEAWGLNLKAGPPDCSTLMRLKQRAVETLRETHYQHELEKTPGLEVLRGHGRFLSPRALQVGAEIVRPDQILIAVGGAPRVLPLPGLDTVDYLTSYSALHLPDFPQSVLMLGGGVIALEMGQMFARFGTQVIILERGKSLLHEFDPRLTRMFADILHSEGVEIMTEVETERVEGRPQGVCLYSKVRGAPVGLCAERLMLAVGTAPATEDIGLDRAGVEVDENGFIKVDAGMRTSTTGIWAAGDVTGPPLIAPAGAREALVAVNNILDPRADCRIDHTHTPMAVFCDPEFATVGLTAVQARARGLEVEEAYVDLDQVPKAHVMGDRRGGVILVAERPSGRVLGCQMLAPRAADIIHEATLAVRFGLDVSQLTTTVHVYPSISDGLRLAARSLARRLGLPIV
ncbi:mercury(II) reductase [Geothermobacter hydrogeniphilus]|uniref:Mercury(II) reductase n=1 Tax=Geothermobacter hydrogeniphilus TaxID=1969733 RepID=A0A2K2H7A0_9BACT|nr:NAD(P)/FAD-dependent oxidoreductase [Geothermobacter hydrogeniphilus]PNU19103.1 mercury(II) reductase [Geothermobacter hydrogeniphilus]